MMLRDLPPDELADRLRRDGVVLTIGPFAVAVRSNEAALAAALPVLYGAFPVRKEPGLVDVHIGVFRRRFRGGLVSTVDGLPHARIAQRAFAPLLMDWALNWTVATRAHRYLILHAAVAERPEGAVVMPAPPGSGKSTLCAALVARGWRLLSDEIALLRPEDGLVAPIPRAVPLKGNSIATIRSFAPGTRFGPCFPGTAKGDVAHVLPADEDVRRQGTPARPAWLVFPRWRAGAAPELIPMGRAEGFAAVVDNAMNYAVSGPDGFAAVDRLIAGTRAVRFGYDDLEGAVAALDAMVKEREAAHACTAG